MGFRVRPPRINYRTLAEITAISYSNYWVRLSSAEGETQTALVPSAVSQQTRVLWANSRPAAVFLLTLLSGTLGTASGWMTQ